jgi:2-methylisocitrate lyase-like PEP mutase family enzyme
VNVTHLPQRSSLAELTSLGVSRVSWAIFLYVAAMARFEEQLAVLQD